jgi:hypothetical protein
MGEKSFEALDREGLKRFLSALGANQCGDALDQDRLTPVEREELYLAGFLGPAAHQATTGFHQGISALVRQAAASRPAVGAE